MVKEGAGGEEGEAAAGGTRERLHGETDPGKWGYRLGNPRFVIGVCVVYLGVVFVRARWVKV